jgi:tetratricopeptide (TPR) repeat protein
VHVDLGYARRWMFDWPGATYEYKRALALAPGSAKVQVLYAQSEAMLGHKEEALAAARRGLELDPLNFWSHKILLDVLRFNGQFEKVDAAVHEAEVLNLGHSNVLAYFMDNALLASGQFVRARQYCESPATPLDEDDRHLCLAVDYHALGRNVDAGREFEKLKALDNDDEHCAAREYADVYAQWGEKAAALQSLARQERVRIVCLINLKVAWELDPLREESQFKALVKRLNFPP